MNKDHRYLIWWTSQEDCERIAPLDTWPTWLYDEFNSRMGRPGRGRLWVPESIDRIGDVPQGVTVWDDVNNWLCKAANNAGGIVIPASEVHHVQFMPGFVSTFEMTLPQTV